MGIKKFGVMASKLLAGIKGSQATPPVASVKPEHPFTAISPACDVHANHAGSAQ
jgi:hypothetical protein